MLIEGLLEAIEQAPLPVTFEEVFGDIPLIYPPPSREDEEEVLKKYEDFLEGKITVAEIFYLENLCEPQKARYAIWDIDGDGGSELVIQDTEVCVFLKVQEGNLFIWKAKRKEEEWYYLLESGQILLEVNPGDEQPDKSKRYTCYTLEFNGEETGFIRIAYTDENGNRILDEEDIYSFNLLPAKESPCS